MPKPEIIPGLSGLPAVPPSGFFSIAGYLRNFYPDIKMKIQDFGAEKTTKDNQLQAIAIYKPDIIALSARSFIFNAAVALANEIKKTFPAIKIVFGGQHATLLKNQETYPSAFDCVVFGEGEQALHKLVQQYIIGIPWPRTLQTGYLKQLSHDYAWDILSSKNFYTRAYVPFYTDPIGSVVWSRGCPFNCFFCSNPAIWEGSKPRVRYRTPDSIANELEFLAKKYKVKRLFVHDNTLNANLKQLEKICSELVARKITIKWAASGLRTEKKLTPEFLFPMLYEAGCRYVSFGIESGNPDVLKKIGRPGNLVDIERALALAKKAGLKTSAGFTIGHLWKNEDGSIGGESEDQIKDTIDYIKKLLDKKLLWTYRPYIVTPNRGSRLYEMVISKGMLSCDDSERLDRFYKSKPVFSHPELDGETIMKYFHQAYALMSFSPRHIIRLLSGIRSIADLLGLLRSGWFTIKNQLFRK